MYIAVEILSCHSDLRRAEWSRVDGQACIHLCPHLWLSDSSNQGKQNCYLLHPCSQPTALETTWWHKLSSDMLQNIIVSQHQEGLEMWSRCFPLVSVTTKQLPLSLLLSTKVS